MRVTRTYGSERGAPGNRGPYRTTPWPARFGGVAEGVASGVARGTVGSLTGPRCVLVPHRWPSGQIAWLRHFGHYLAVLPVPCGLGRLTLCGFSSNENTPVFRPGSI